MKIRNPFMLRSTHERMLAMQELELTREEEVTRLHYDAAEERWNVRADELIAEVRRIAAGVVQPDSYYFPASAVAEPEQKPAKAPEEPRRLSGFEVVQRAETHRNLHRRTN